MSHCCSVQEVGSCPSKLLDQQHSGLYIMASITTIDNDSDSDICEEERFSDFKSLCAACPSTC